MPLRHNLLTKNVCQNDKRQSKKDILLRQAFPAEILYKISKNEHFIARVEKLTREKEISYSCDNKSKKRET